MVQGYAQAFYTRQFVGSSPTCVGGERIKLAGEVYVGRRVLGTNECRVRLPTLALWRETVALRMAQQSDLKSGPRMGLWVRVPPRLLNAAAVRYRHPFVWCECEFDSRLQLNALVKLGDHD